MDSPTDYSMVSHRRLFHVTLVSITTILAFSCTKSSAIEYDLDGIGGKWLVTSTTGNIVVMLDNAFAVNDTVRYYNGVGEIYVSRPGQNRHYNEIRDIHFYLQLGGVPDEERLSFTVLADYAYTFELIESGKDHLVFQFKDNGAKVSMKKEE